MPARRGRWRTRSGSRSAIRRRRGRGTARRPRRPPRSIRASGRSILLMTRITGSRRSSALRSTNRVWGSGPSLASTSSSTPSTIVKPALHLAPEVGVAGGVDDVELDAAVADRRVLGEDRDPLLALEIHRVEHSLGHRLARPERAGLPQQRVDQRRLAVVDVGDDRDVADVGAQGHGLSASLDGTGASTSGVPYGAPGWITRGPFSRDSPFVISLSLVRSAACSPPSRRSCSRRRRQARIPSPRQVYLHQR